MPRRRPFRRLVAASVTLLNRGRSCSSATASAALARAAHPVSRDLLCGYGVEFLERRVMLTVYGGAPGSAANSGQVEFFNLSGGQIRLAWHDATFEVIDALVPMGAGTGTEVDPPLTDVGTAPTVVPNIYAIDVLQSSLDSWISIAAVPASTATGDRAMIPFGAAPTLNVVDSGIPTSGTLIAAPIGANVGSVLLGAVTSTTTDAGLPILSIPNAMLPGDPFNPGGTITPGVYMSPVALTTAGTPIIGPGGLETPNDLGRFFFGGVITGAVNVPAPASGTVPPAPASQGGNIGVFYAGAILTGDATGGLGELGGVNATSLYNVPNFTVGGDVRDLITSGAIGGGRGAATRADVSQYATGLRLVVAGTVGEISERTGGFYGSVDVEHLPTIYGLPNNLFEEHELEAVDQFNTPEPGAYFGPVFEPGNGDQSGLLASLTGYPLLASDFFDNNVTPDAAGVASEGDAQYLDSFKETSPNTGLPITDANGNDLYYDAVDGVVEGDAPHSESVDNYAVPLLAGQTITPTLTLTSSGEFNGLTLELVDPDGRVVASQSAQSTAQQLSGASTTPFQYTADRPGVYAFRISLITTAGVLRDVSYSLIVTGVGDLGLGTLITGNNGSGAAQTTDIIDTGLADSFEVDHADLGALIAPPGASIASNAALDNANPDAVAIDVPAGSLRIVKGGQLGISIPDGGGGFAPNGPFGSNNEFGSEPVLGVPAGQVGLLEGLDVAGFTSVLSSFDPNNAANVLGQAFVVPTTPIGGNIQMIDGAGYVFLDLATNQGIGDIIAGRMDATTAGVIDVNADNAGNDGIIDMINVQGNLGTLAQGGPSIRTNTGGYVEFMHVGGSVFQDEFFGNPVSTPRLGAPGTPLTYTEDTGATLTFTPTGAVTTTTITNNGVVTTSTAGPQVSLLTYGIRDKGGGVIISATVQNNTVASGGLTITAKGGTGSPSAQVADVSQINLDSTSTTSVGTTLNALGEPILDSNGEPLLTATTGAAVFTNGTTTTTGTATSGTTTTATTTTTTTTGNSTTASVSIIGTAAVDVLGIAITGTGVADAIVNNTPGGEIGSISAGTVVNLSSAGTIGLLAGTTAAVVTLSNGNGTAATTLFAQGDAFPFDLQTTGISISGNVLSIRSALGLGNISVGGSIGSITAGTGRAVAASFAGINGPIIAGVSGAPAAGMGFGTNFFSVSNNIGSVNIGQGVLPSGTGTFSRAGIYAQGDIGIVTNAGRAQADIRGSVVAEAHLDRITLTNASIIGATVGVAFPVAGTQIGAELTIPVSSAPGFENITNLSVNGRGGIIGSLIIGANISRISVGPLGFGIIDSSIEGTGGGVYGSISAGGYGIRDSDIIGGSDVNSISATGNGSQLPVTAFGTDLRQSETHSFDTFSGLQLTAANDLDAALGTSAGVAVIPASTDTGVLQDDSVELIGTLGSVSAQTVRTAESLTSLIEAEPQANIPRPGESFPMELNVAGVINAVNIRGAVDGLQITTGTLRSFRQTGGASRLGISVAGTIGNLTITGNYGQLITDPGSGATIPDSFIQATGPTGTIDNLTIDGNLNAPVTANVAIEKMTVMGNVVGSITALGQTRGTTLGTLRIGGALKDGSLTIDGPAGSIIANAGLGDSTGTLTVNGSLQELEVGAAHARGSTLASAVDVTGTLGKLIVNGSITGALTVGGDLTTLKVTGDGSNPNIISAPITVGGRIYTATLVDGNLSANITANGFIRSFTVRDGNVASTATIESQLDAIENFRILGGTGFGLLGSLDAPNGSGGLVDISGNLGDGTDAASIIEGSGKRFHIRGSVLGNARISLSGGLDLLQVDGNIAAGAIITAHPLTKLTVGGTNAGTVTQS